MLVMVVQETFKTLQATVVALGCLAEVEDECVLMKISCTSETGPRGPDLNLT